eukprot:2724881-Prymnesium_polylepis.1
MGRDPASAALQAGGCGARGGHASPALAEASRQVRAPRLTIGGSQRSRGRGRQMGPDAPFWIRTA